MSIIESTTSTGGWEIKATGEDIPKLSGMLQPYAKEKYREAFHKNEGQYERITDPSGNPTVVHKNDVEVALSQGYGRAASRPVMVMPEVPWKQTRLGAGRWRYSRDELGQLAWRRV